MASVRFCGWRWLLLTCLLCTATPAQIQSLPGLKAAYIYNMAKFTRWPDSAWDVPDAPFQLCLYGEGDVIDDLAALENSSLGGREIRILQPETEATFGQCHLLYISSSERRRYRYLLSLANTGAVLTISDDTRFLRQGGLINLTEVAQRLRFEVNMAQLARSELQLSSKLLKLAILVENPK